MPRCGDAPFLRQVAEFRWYPNNLAPDRHIVLFDPAADPPVPADPHRFDA